MAEQPSAPPPPPPPPIPGQGAPGQRPAAATTSAVLLFTVGGIRALIALIAIFFVAAAADELSSYDDAGVLIGVIFFVVGAMLTSAVLQIFGGVHTLKMRTKGWGMGLAGSIIGLVLGVLSLVGAAQGTGTPANLVIVLLLLVGDIVILIYLGQAKRFMTAS